MKLVIYGNKHYEEEKALIDLDNKEVILKGDYYHDKIDEKIEGYLQALFDFSIYQQEVNEEYIDRNHELYEYLKFYDEEYEEE